MHMKKEFLTPSTTHKSAEMKTTLDMSEKHEKQQSAVQTNLTK